MDNTIAKTSTKKKKGEVEMGLIVGIEWNESRNEYAVFFLPKEDSEEARMQAGSVRLSMS
jgi:hypothetical protein